MKKKKIIKTLLVLAIVFILADVAFLFSKSNLKIVDAKNLPVVLSSCEDSDQGVEPFFKGSVTIGPSGKKYDDYCIGDDTLVEYSCNRNKIASEQIKCELGCSTGLCFDPEPHLYLTLTVYSEALVNSEEDWDRYDVIYNFSNYDKTNSIMADFFNTEKRENIKDSYGVPHKISWMAYSSEDMCNANNADCTSLYDVLTNNWGKEIEKYGDTVEWHLHNEYWHPNGECWTQALFFDEDRQEVAERILNHLVIDHSYFPSVYGGGWAWMDNDLSNFLDNLVFSEYTNIAPFKNMPGAGGPPDCSGNYYDWSRAPDDWGFYNPSVTDYQIPGDQNRTVFRCKEFSIVYLYQMFNRAEETNENVMGCFFIHNTLGNEGMYVANFLNNNVKNLAELYSIPVSYVNVREATQIALQTTDQTPAELILNYNGDNLVNIQSNEPLYSIYSAIKYDNNYQRVEVTQLENSYQAIIPKDIDDSFVFAVATTDLAGNVNVVQKTYTPIKPAPLDRTLEKVFD
ncbi:MAG: hypothetical protein KKF48_04740 [Nanoarchaeota archaeon]|nr:hypothetical protein [Nanoarchaeota archaeon]MBU1028324.1 hypothetical protein [Nanoarchaeota archaeon]